MTETITVAELLLRQMDPNNPYDDEMIEVLKAAKRPHPDEHLGQRFPVHIHHEDNRQAHIRHWNYHNPNGWLPCGDNWWLFKKSHQWVAKAKKNHEDTNDLLRRQGWLIVE